MPTQVSYPGVYIEEIPSGVRTITGVATSITAFVGRTLRGPVNEPRTINNFGEFERIFGGLAADHTVAYAVQDFFANGGGQAIVVRLYKPFFADDLARAAALATANAQAQTAAGLVSAAATTAAGNAAATPATVAAAAAGQVATAGLPGPAAALAAQKVADAAQAEATRAPYMTTSQRLSISGDPTGGSITLDFKGQETAALALSDLNGVGFAATLKSALEALSTIGANNIGTVTRSGTAPNQRFLIPFAGALAGPQDLITLKTNSLTGGTSPTATVALPLPDPATVATAASAAVTPAATSAAGIVAPINRARFNFANGLTLEAASPGAWGNALKLKVDYQTRPKDDGTLDASLFNLAVRDAGTGRTELIRNVTGAADAVRNVGRVLSAESSLVRVVGTAPVAPPAVGEIEVDVAGRAGDSTHLVAADVNGSRDQKTGLFALEKADLFNLLCIPPDSRDGDTDAAVYQKAMAYCQERRAMLIVDSPAAWGANPDTAAQAALDGLPLLNLNGPSARNAALYFPRQRQADPMRDGQLDTFVTCGAVAGVFARTDATRGVWKAPAGLDAALNGIAGLQLNLSDGENGRLNPQGINSLRTFPVGGSVVWGARTLRGADSIGDEYKYIPVRRLALFIEETLYRSTQWVVFEPNDEPLWAQIRLNLGAFMQNLFRQGAFQGKSPREAYFVKCDSETTIQNDINLGIVNIVVGFAPLKPAEFVIIKIQQIAGQIAT